MTLIPGIKQISLVGNDMYIQGAFPVSVANTDVSYLADPADTRLLAGRDPVIEEVSVGMSGSETGIETVSGAAPLQITDAMQGMLRFLETNIKPVQDLHGYANPWPAGGGVNKWDNTAMTLGYWCGSDGTITEVLYGAISDAIPINGQTVFSIKQYGENPYSYSIIEYASDDTFIKRNHYSGNYGLSVTLNENTAYIKTQVACTPTNTLTADMIAGYKMLLCYGSLPDSWSPYANICPIQGWTGCNVYVSPTTNQADATVYPCTWQDDAGTVYGGTADVIGGWGNINQKHYTFTGNENITITDEGLSTQMFVISGLDVIRHGNATEPMHCTQYKYVPWSSNPWNVDMSCSYYNTYSMRIKDSRFATVPEFKTFLASQYSAGTPVELTYQSAALTSFQFSGNQILTQEGTNYIWTDCGDTITAAYVAVK